MKTLVKLTILLLISTLTLAQSKSIFYDQNFLKAINQQTRTTIGIPGPNYWTNSAKYHIKAKINPKEKILIGSETITYYNNSPDTLNFLILKLYQNLYKADMYRTTWIDPQDVHNGIKIQIWLNNKTIQPQINGTIAKIKLPTPLVPNDSLILKINWQFKIPQYSDVRMGAKDSTSFFLGQWFPRVAVYDDVYGWDLIQYTGRHEFYYDLSDFFVEIQVPENYIVWATGKLQNPEQILYPKVFQKYYLATTKLDTSITIVSYPEDYTSKVSKAGTWKFVAKNVSDFAFAVSNHFNWQAKTIKLTNKTVLIQTAYPPEAKDFPKVLDIAADVIRYYSFEFPAVEYPFESMTVVNGTNGTSGMEYPMIVNNPSSQWFARTIDVTAHEIAHTYFPFTVLTNEHEFAWMDEAFAVILPFEYQMKTDSSLNRLRRYKHQLEQNLASGYVPPLFIRSSMQIGRGYYFSQYEQGAMFLHFLEKVIGREKFRQIIAEFIHNWQGKHPVNYDFINFLVANGVDSALVYSWFYQPLLIDYQIVRRHTYVKDGFLRVMVENKGYSPAPYVNIEVWTDKGKLEFSEDGPIFPNAMHMFQFELPKGYKVKKVKVFGKYVPEVNYSNNVYEFVD